MYVFIHQKPSFLYISETFKVVEKEMIIVITDIRENERSAWKHNDTARWRLSQTFKKLNISKLKQIWKINRSFLNIFKIDMIGKKRSTLQHDDRAWWRHFWQSKTVLLLKFQKYSCHLCDMTHSYVWKDTFTWQKITQKIFRSVSTTDTRGNERSAGQHNGRAWWRHSWTFQMLEKTNLWRGNFCLYYPTLPPPTFLSSAFCTLVNLIL